MQYYLIPRQHWDGIIICTKTYSIVLAYTAESQKRKSSSIRNNERRGLRPMSIEYADRSIFL